MKQTLAVSIFRPETAPKACVEIVHGMSEHRSRYDEFAKYLVSRGYAAVTYDLPGHGETAGKDPLGYFGDENGWQTLTDSAEEIAERCRSEFPGVPLILFGHSMGTIIGRCFLQKHDNELCEAILSGAPNYQSAIPVAIFLGNVTALFKGKKGHSKMLDSLSTGTFAKSVKNARTDFDWLSYNSKNVDAYIADPLCGFPFTVAGYQDLFHGTKQMHEVSAYACTKPDLPILFFSGKDDPCRGGDAGFQDSIDTLKKAGYKNVDSHLYDGMRHETMHEDAHMQVFADAADWMDRHLPAKG